MQGTKYLGEIIKEEGIELGSNTLIVAPVGSGKTYYILNDLVPQAKRVLYLCDNGNLKSQVEKDSDKAGIKDMICKFDVLSYKAFGMKVKNDTLNKFIKQYDMIICDEVHNLLDYQNFSNDADLLVARIKLFDKYEYTKIVFFTATPYYLDQLAKDNKDLGNYFITYDFTNHPNINKYVNKRLAYMNHYSDVEKTLKEYEGYFKDLNGKCLMYTQRIEVMEKLKTISLEAGLKPICIWSTNSKEMTEEQNKVRNHLLETGELLEPYNILIINRATETGVNIIDKDMNLVIVNTTNITQQVQARGRVRHDIDLLVLKTKDMKKVEFILDEDLIDKWLYKATIEEFIIAKNNLRNSHGRPLSIKGLEPILIQHRYKLEKRRTRVEGKQVTQYMITHL